MVADTRSVFSRRLRRVALVLSAIAALGAVLFISVTPAVHPGNRPSAGDVRAAREAWDQLKAGQTSRLAVTPMEFDDRMVRGLAALASDAAGTTSFDARVADGVLSGEASIALPAGLWVNVTASTTGSASGFPPLRMTVGRVRLPVLAGRWSAEAARAIFNLKGGTLPPLDEMVRQVRITEQALFAELALQGSGLIDEVMAAGRTPINHQWVRDSYCRLVAAQRGQPTSELSGLVRQAFADLSVREDDTRARFVALALLVVEDRAEALVPGAAVLMEECPRPKVRVLLQQRADLAQHWTFSAALASVLGPRAAGSLGEWKELDDSLPAGSGFSFVDIAADRAGLQTALRALDPATAGATIGRLARASEETLLPKVLLQAPEGLSDADFEDRFGGLDQDEYARAIAAIDQRLGPRDR